MKFGSLFAGIGGMDLGLERAGMECRWQIEIDDWCRHVLTKHWPDVPKYTDIKEVRGDELEPVDLICGGFPCQDLSLAGKGAGLSGRRSGLWSEFARLVRVVRPSYVLVENVPGLLGRGMGVVLGDLSALGYDAEWESLPAAAFGAPHIRSRVFIVAHTSSPRHGSGGPLQGRTSWHEARGPGPERLDRLPGGQGDVAHAQQRELQRLGGPRELPGAPREAQGEGDQRQRGRDTAGRGCEDVADAQQVGRGGLPDASRGDHRDGYDPRGEEEARGPEQRREDVANADPERWDGRPRRLRQGRGPEPEDGGEPLPDAHGERLAQRQESEREAQGGLKAPHRHDLMRLRGDLAYANEPGLEERPGGDGARGARAPLEFAGWWAAEPAICGVVDGVSEGLDGGLDAGKGVASQGCTQGGAEESLRDVWERFAAGDTPHGRESDEQLAGELADALSSVSHPLALGEREATLAAIQSYLHGLRQACEALGALRDTSESLPEAWQSLPSEEKDWAHLATRGGPWVSEWPSTPRIASKIPRRVDRLRGLGNAVVPQVAQWIGERIMEAR